MFKLKQIFFGEASVTKVAGLFATRLGADQAMASLMAHSALAPSQLRLLGPASGSAAEAAALARSVEPEVRGIWRTIVRAHVVMASLGFLAGALTWALLMGLGNAALTGTPGMGFVALAGFGATFGLILGGAIALRPDHGRVIGLVRRALQRGQWAVVAHPTSAGQTDQAIASLGTGSLRVVRSF